ncbi:aromatic amino acid hydroxylase [Sphingobacterium sp. HJSM2_6]|uniref:aromatic amino acid hydroxylase n=1 Tax=Sphingobacterium sp. HJSM2_6 TaxID=3366264 RepID=UPI003BD8CCC2
MQTYNNPILEKLPKHLAPYVVAQNYNRYTAEDQAIWRYVMRQNYEFLKEVAFYPYIPGLRKAGLSIEYIPDLQQMNDSLQKIGWAAVTVDGFIPPAAFMEFQANCVLVIAADIRQIDHITYTPAPDIIHESSGHAPIIGEPAYAAYLQYFGKIGTKAMSSAKDFAVYEAIRELSILKEQEHVKEHELAKANEQLDLALAIAEEPSEMTLLSRLHWWTVEYGLIGTVEDFKIYGAGLLSSIGESASCLQEDVKKLNYTLAALDYAYDITKPQPQLFVSRDFEQAYQVLEEFANQMAFRQGGKVGICKAVNSGHMATAVYSSGLQVSGIFQDINLDNDLVYIKTNGPTALSIDGKELQGHGTSYHQDGFGSPVGKLIGYSKPLEDFTFIELNNAGIIRGEWVSILFESGIKVTGEVIQIWRSADKNILISFDKCITIHIPSQTVLFQPEWGIYDMALGEAIHSVYAGAADKLAFEPVSKLASSKKESSSISKKKLKLFGLYAKLRNIREDQPNDIPLFEIYEILKNEYPKDWLAMLEVYELAHFWDYSELGKFALTDLNKKMKKYPEFTKQIQDGIRLATLLKINFDLTD